MSPKEIADYVSETAFAWPGGYEMFALTDDGGVLCRLCCATERDLIAASYPGDGWHATAFDHEGNTDAHVECDHCHRIIHESDEDMP